MIKIFIIIITLIFTPSLLAKDIVRYVDSIEHPDKKAQYFVDLLALTMEVTREEFGDYELQPIAIEMTQERTSSMLELGQLIDVTWRVTSKDLEQQLQAIYIPLLKGVMGHRIFVIRAGEQYRFHNQMNLSELKLMSAGQGYNWPDSEILKYNGLKLTEGYDIYLLKMLARKRFDYFPRALHEPWVEIADNKSFEVEQQLLLKYYSPMFFFVNNKNTRLANRLNKGLNILITSKKFDVFFQNHPITANILAKAQIAQRKIFELENPLMSEKTKALVEDPRLWIVTSKK